MVHTRHRLDHLLVAIMMGGMVTVAFLNVLGRYLFHYSLAFTEEITIHLFVLLTVLGSGIAFERGAHLGMITVNRLLPPRIRSVVAVIGALLSAGMFLTIDILLIRAIVGEMTLFQARSPALNIPVWIYYAAVVVVSPWVFIGIYRGSHRST